MDPLASRILEAAEKHQDWEVSRDTDMTRQNHRDLEMQSPDFILGAERLNFVTDSGLND